MRPRLPVLLSVVVVCALVAGPARADVLFSLDVDRTVADVGDTILVDVVVPVAGDAFNGYDALVDYDDTALAPLIPVPASAGEGELFTQTCGLRFLDTEAGGDTARVRISHVLLCAGTNVTGPGRVYSFAFIALANSSTSIGLGPGTQAYDAGERIPTTTGAAHAITIGEVTTAPAPRSGPTLRAYPNPFNPSTTLQIDARRGDTARVTIHDAAGRLVRTVFDGTLPAPRLALRWNGRDASGRGVASGLYHARLHTARGDDVVRLVLVR